AVGLASRRISRIPRLNRDGARGRRSFKSRSSRGAFPNPPGSVYRLYIDVTGAAGVGRQQFFRGGIHMAAAKSDIEIARAATKKPIMEIGARLGIPPEQLLPYGHDKAKISAAFIKTQRGKEDGKLILVTAINPTP